MKTTHYLLITFSLLLLGACASSKDGEGTDFSMSTYQAFIFGDIGAVSSDDLRFRSPEFEARVKEELRFKLPSKGLQESTSNAQLLIYFFTLPEDDEDFQFSALPYDNYLSEDESAIPINHNFVIDFVDRNTRLLVFRSTAEINLENSEKRNAELPSTIARMLRDLPT